MYKGDGVADRLRRPVEAGDRLPHALAAAPPSAGPRGLPGRRLLPALPPARARREALRRARRRLADRAADHRDEGRRRLRVHPDQRHLDHRRPDLPRARPVLLRRPAGDQRRHLGVARRRQRADQGDEEGRRPPAARPRAVPRARGVRAVRLRARQGLAAAARPRRPRRRDPQAAAVRAAARRAAGGGDLRRDRRRTSTTCRSRTRSGSSRSSIEYLETRHADILETIRDDGRPAPTRPRRR